jgi:hypothetical protein
MRIFNWILASLLASVIYANAQAYRRICKTCDESGLTVTGMLSYHENAAGTITFYFNNFGRFNWKIESVHCEFRYRNNSLFYDHSYDMQRFEVSPQTSAIRAHTREVNNLPRDVKAICWIESAAH